jgi:transcriptional regulator with XRE-family HTH domain
MQIHINRLAWDGKKGDILIAFEEENGFFDFLEWARIQNKNAKPEIKSVPELPEPLVPILSEDDHAIIKERKLSLKEMVTKYVSTNTTIGKLTKGRDNKPLYRGLISKLMELCEILDIPWVGRGRSTPIQIRKKWELLTDERRVEIFDKLFPD